MSIEKGKDYITLVEVKGIAPKGTKIKPWTVKKGNGPETEIVKGKSGDTFGFNLVSGGGIFLKEDEVTLA